MVVIGSRESELALIQTHSVQRALEKLYPNLSFTVNAMTTTGDEITNKSLSTIGTKALFTKELEQALERRQVDMVVHSLKDMPTTLPPGMTICCVLKRTLPNDVVISKTTLELLEHGSIIGTSSVRRAAQLKLLYPHLAFKDIRGNLNTRLKKYQEGNYDAIILAHAGIERMGWTHLISQTLACDHMPYAVGQGAISIECREDDTETKALLAPLQDRATWLTVMCERSFMRALEGGCSVPLGVNALLEPGKLTFTGCVTGEKRVQATRCIEADVITLELAEGLGLAVANALVEMGANEILAGIRAKSALE